MRGSVGAKLLLCYQKQVSTLLFWSGKGAPICKVLLPAVYLRRKRPAKSLLVFLISLELLSKHIIRFLLF